MIRLAAVVVVMAALAGCSTAPKITVRTIVEPCPTVAPPVSCPGLPSRAGKIFGDWSDEADIAMQQCALALRTWERIHGECVKGLD